VSNSQSTIDSATDEAGAVPLEEASDVAEVAHKPSRTFLRASQRELTEQEAASPAGLRWLTYDIERLEAECFRLSERLAEVQDKHDVLRDTYSDQRVEIEKLGSRARVSIRNELLSYLCFSVGSVGLGVTPSLVLVQATALPGTILLAVSSLLLLGGLVLRVWK
jgi:hypothetical protein